MTNASHWASAARFRPSPHAVSNRVRRAVWGVAWSLLVRPSPRPARAWRRAVLRAFGAQVGQGAVIQPSVRIWAPWNLEMGRFSCLADGVDCYSVAHIVIGAYATVSQGSVLCTASHDIDSPDMALTTGPIAIGDHAWVASGAFIGPGVTLGEGAVAGARACVVRSVSAWTVVAGNPARVLRMRGRTVADRRAGDAA